MTKATTQASLPPQTKPTLRTKYQFIHFERSSHGGWLCVNNKSYDTLGVLVYYRRWRQYVYQPEPDTVYSAGCLADIQAFIAALAAEKP